MTIEEKIAAARKAASDKVTATGTAAEKEYASQIAQTYQNASTPKTMGQIDPGLTRTTAQNKVDTNVSNMGTGSTNQFNSNALMGSGLANPTSNTGFEQMGYDPEQIAAYNTIQQKYLDLASKPIEVAGLKELQDRQTGYLDAYDSLGRQIIDAEGRIKGVGEALSNEGGEITNIARGRIETKQTAPLREELTTLLSTQQDFSSIIGDVNTMMNTAVDNARAERQQQLIYLNQFIENSPMTTAQKELVKAQAQSKADELYNTEVQYARQVETALANNDISFLDDQSQYKIIQGQVDQILSSPAFKGIATQRSPQQIVSDIQKAIQSGSNLNYELSQLQSQMKSKPEYTAKEAAAQKKISGGTSGSSSGGKTSLTNTQKLKISEKYGIPLANIPKYAEDFDAINAKTAEQKYETVPPTSEVVKFLSTGSEDDRIQFTAGSF